MSVEQYSSTAQQPLVVELAPEIAPASVGAKAANLGKVIQQGLSVPPGFVVAREGLHLFLQANNLHTQITAWLAGQKAGNRRQNDEAYNALCQQITAAPLPQQLIDAIAPLLKTLLAQAPHGLAVRSSGIYEDSAAASFAGVYDSFLGIRSTEDFHTALKRCWCAAWSPPALAYATRMGIAPETDALAVLVQPLLQATSAGVLFTADPQTGNPWRFVLESTFGLAQDLVGAAGNLPVDRFVFAWDSGQIIDKQIAVKETICRPCTTGVETVPLVPERGSLPSLNDETARRIAQLALDLDRAFSCRVDIEWVVVDDQIHIVQVRPITALPAFFPHHLPWPAAAQTWVPATLWHFAFRRDGELMSPLYRDLLISEKHSRYLQLGPVQMPAHLKPGSEADFNGYRYMPADNEWPRLSNQQQEAYLEQWEHALRRDYLDAFQHRFPGMGDEAIRRKDEAKTLAEQIDALLWARDAVFDMYSLTAGPSQSFFAITAGLLRHFLDQYLADCDTEDLQQGHHPDLDPYYPHIQVAEAEKLAQHIGPDQQLFDQSDADELLEFLRKKRLSPPFVQAFTEYCDRFGLLPPNRLDEAEDNDLSQHHFVLRLVCGALKGSTGVETRLAQATQRRLDCVAAARQHLEQNHPEQIPRFERLLDWTLFWGPALNNRAWTTRPGGHLWDLWHTMCNRLQQAGLFEAPEDIDYFTAADLAHIAATGDLDEGRMMWKKRRLEYEGNQRLEAPAYLGKAPDEPEETAASPVDNRPKKTAVTTGPVIQGRGGVPGQAEGIAFKIESLDEADEADEEHILIFARPLQPSSATTPLLFSLTLRVRALVSPQGPMMWMHHIGQIARECGVPVVQVAPEDIERLEAGCRLAVDGGKGTVTILD
ncbi:MAG: hypothetical protein GKR89_34725 [Candidatus Latescibacteria bacterium]|nr:hypothetical protein [Candidatus Latescibacterota bacterium]